MAAPLLTLNVHHGHLHVRKTLGSYSAKSVPQLLRTASVKASILTLTEDLLDPSSDHRTTNMQLNTPHTLH